MLSAIDEQVVGFYDVLFGRIFSEPFRSRVAQPLRRRAVMRQVEESADAASQSLARFFLNRQLTEQQVADVLGGFAALGDLLKLDDIANPNVTPEAVVDGLMPDLPCPETVRGTGHDAVYRVGLHSIVQVLMLVGPVMAEWRKLDFATTFELPRRVVNRLNQISEQMDALGRSGPDAADERYELSYRDYLLQRFHRVEAGTVRMTTNLAVDLRELFVMPHVRTRPLPERTDGTGRADPTALMDLAAAREIFEDRDGRGERAERTRERDDRRIIALDQVKRYPRTVIVGAPGSGKSTFCEWLQVKLASVEEELVLAGQQAIPLLLRVRELDPRTLPRGAALIEKATVSKDRAALMPQGWVQRQMKAGRVLFMLDGLDETEPDLRDHYVIPWLRDLCERYPECHYLISSRPVGYPPGMFRALEFVECDLLDFEDPQVREYGHHWCTAVRLARNEPEEEARREGVADGEHIVRGFEDHPYIRDLARNPLMLSAICLVNYFEGGHLPEDRSVLYKLCVEGLLHYWDQRRGIHSEFSFDEKLRACREVALAMLADDRAEYEAEKVQGIFTEALGDSARAESLLTHIRYRTGLLLERRPEVFAFAHLTFQEYLTAREIAERGKYEMLASHFGGAHWQEVTLLCARIRDASDLLMGILSLPEERITEHWKLLLQVREEAQDMNEKTRKALVDRPLDILKRATDPTVAVRASLYLRHAKLDFKARVHAFENAEGELGKGHLALLLGETGDVQAVEVLEPHLTDENRHVRCLSALALDMLGFAEREVLDDLLMVEIPAGEFMFGDRTPRRKPTEAFLMDRFPLTNAQYRRFIEEGGYQERRYWSEEGWNWKEEEGRSEPDRLSYPDFSISSAPVVTITWYEAQAYAKWAGKRLPTEEEWERAARGDEDAREYPWGDEFEESRCNVDESIGQTTPVGSYPGGRLRGVPEPIVGD